MCGGRGTWRAMQVTKNFKKSYKTTLSISIPATVPVQFFSFILPQKGVPVVAVNPHQLLHRRRLNSHLRRFNITPLWPHVLQIANLFPGSHLLHDLLWKRFHAAVPNDGWTKDFGQVALVHLSFLSRGHLQDRN